jgi:hypothetical protein
MKLLSMRARLSILDSRLTFTECPSCHKQAELTRSGICYECTCSRDGRPRFEWHHVHLEKIDPDTKVKVPGNLHQTLTRRSQTRYPILKEPSMDKKIKAAQRLTDAAEILELISSQPPNPDELAATRELAAVIAKACRGACNELLEEDR